MIRNRFGDIAQVIRDGLVVDQAIMAARRRVIRRHRQQGVPLAVWKDGHVVELAPDSQEVEEQAGNDDPVEA